MKILIIEDEPQMRLNITTILEMEGITALSAADGVEGVARAKQERPSLILCDVMMPRLDGHGVLRELRADPGTVAIPFLFLTARGEKTDIRDGMNMGADDYLTKPVGRAELLGAIAARTRRAQQQSSGFHPDFSSSKPLETALHLTPREAEVLLWVAQGKSNADIAIILDTTEVTVKKHLQNLFAKLGVESRNGATFRALEVLSGGAA